ncbi:hypothetical protein C0J52_26533 [Blattella germanica]|nr:hypothetical protein C0J52_26533 [Blattella germanica]
MLSMEEELAQLTDYICRDHCYTSSPFSSRATSSLPNRRHGSVSNRNQNFDPPVTSAIASTESAIRAKGRGRRPGRPRKDSSIARSSQSSRGTSTRSVGVVRRSRCDGETGTSIPPGMVTVQQIKPMSPSSSPPSSSSLAASLVPLIKPLVMKLDKQLTTTGQMKMQKRVIAVPMKNGGTRLVTITGTNLGQVLTSSQRKVLIANNKLQDSPTPEQEEEHQQQQSMFLIIPTNIELIRTFIYSESQQMLTRHTSAELQ